MTLKERQSEFVELFNSLDSWNDRFQYLIELGETLPTLPTHLETPDAKITSCISSTYFKAYRHGDIVRVYGWSNASTMAGIIALMVDLFDGCSADDLRAIDINFHSDTELINNMTGQRRASLMEMINRLKPSVVC